MSTQRFAMWLLSGVCALFLCSALRAASADAVPPDCGSTTCYVDITATPSEIHGVHSSMLVDCTSIPGGELAAIEMTEHGHYPSNTGDENIRAGWVVGHNSFIWDGLTFASGRHEYWAYDTSTGAGTAFDVSSTVPDGVTYFFTIEYTASNNYQIRITDHNQLTNTFNRPTTMHGDGLEFYQVQQEDINVPNTYVHATVGGIQYKSGPSTWTNGIPSSHGFHGTSPPGFTWVNQFTEYREGEACP